MRYFILAIYILLALFLLFSIKTSERTSGNKGERVISLSKVLFYIGAIGFGLFIIVSIVLFLTSTATSSLVFLLISLLGYALLLAYFNCTITYDEAEFTHKTFLGISRTFSYDDITGIYGKNRDVKIYIGKKSIRVDETSVGKDEFINFVRKQYRKSHDGNAISITKLKSDIFNGNIENPGEFIFVYSLVMALIIGCMILCLAIMISNSSKEVLSDTVSFVRYTEDDNMLSLYTSEDKEYRIGNYQDATNDLDRLIKLCNGKEKLDVTYTIHDDEVRPIHWLKSIMTKDGNILLSAEAVEELEKSDTRITLLVFGGMIVVMLGLIGASIYVGRNADRLKPWIVKLFFKSSYIK